MMRAMLYEAAQTMLVVSTKWSWLKMLTTEKARAKMGRAYPEPAAVC